MVNLSMVFQKKKKKIMKRLSFITLFKIEILLPFTGCRKVLRKMPDSNILLQFCGNLYVEHFRLEL